MTWGPAQMGVAAGITMAVLDGVLPAGGAAGLGGDRLRLGALGRQRCRRGVRQQSRRGAWPRRASAMRPSRISLEELRQALQSQGNVFYTPRR